MSEVVDRPERVHLFGVDIDRLTMTQTVDRVWRWLRDSAGPCRYVVTPNLDHIVRLQRDPAMRSAYRHASLVIADGWPVVTASRWLGRPLPERVAGSDLVPRLLAVAEASSPLTVFLLGAMPGVANRAAGVIGRVWPNVRVVGTFSPPLGFERDREQNDGILQRIAAVVPDLLVVGFGAPKQEIWLDRHHASLKCKVAIAAGATIDFLAGEQRRAPEFLRAIRLEWMYRLWRDPNRLARRYLHDALMFPGILWNEWKSLQRSAR
jgi:N-acetylglucosaminyldiphosphoundecaprenol N-acetyl-beta-D-mannosaminyltransferase